MKENNLKDAIDFYLLATKLKYKIRSGWNNEHWNIQAERRESVAEHIYGTCILAISLYPYSDVKIDLNKTLKMLVIHELGEVIAPDITPFDNISKEEKLKLEHDAILKVVGDLVSKDELIQLILEFDEGKTNEAHFAFQCDKLDADIQSKLYQDKGLHRPLNAQKNNVVMNSSRVQKIIEDGAKTAFDVWYEYDKDLYDENSIFEKALEYIKKNNTNK